MKRTTSTRIDASTVPRESLLDLARSIGGPRTAMWIDQAGRARARAEQEGTRHG